MKQFYYIVCWPKYQKLNGVQVVLNCKCRFVEITMIIESTGELS